MKFSEQLRKKLDFERSRLGKRSTPYIKWLEESEDDSKVSTQELDFSNGINTFSRALTDYMSGIAVLAGLPNSGKSTVAVNLMMGGLRNNKDLVVLDFTFDDPLAKRYQQVVACLSGLSYQTITTNVIMTPEERTSRIAADKYIDELVASERYFIYEGMEQINMADEGEDPLISWVNMRKVENISIEMFKARKKFPDKKIVVFIDAWNNIECRSNSRISEVAEASERVNDLKTTSEQAEIPVFMSAHIRKDGLGKRSTMDSIKGTAELTYAPNWIGVIRNEYRENLVKNPLMYEDSQGRRKPVVTVEVVKTKVSTWDLPLYYVLYSERCGLQPPTKMEYFDFYRQWNGSRD